MPEPTCHARLRAATLHATVLCMVTPLALYVHAARVPSPGMAQPEAKETSNKQCVYVRCQPRYVNGVHLLAWWLVTWHAVEPPWHLHPEERELSA